MPSDWQTGPQMRLVERLLQWTRSQAVLVASAANSSRISSCDFLTPSAWCMQKSITSTLDSRNRFAKGDFSGTAARKLHPFFRKPSMRVRNEFSPPLTEPYSLATRILFFKISPKIQCWSLVEPITRPVQCTSADAGSDFCKNRFAEIIKQNQ